MSRRLPAPMITGIVVFPVGILKWLCIDLEAARTQFPAALLILPRTSERFRAKRIEVTIGSGSYVTLVENPDPDAAPAFFVQTDAEVTLT